MTNFSIGLDLGQVRDYSALVVSERQERMVGRPRETSFDPDAGYRPEDVYHVRHIQRFELGTPYTSVVEQVCELTRTPELRDQTVLLFDKTGVGGAVADLFVEAYRGGRLGTPTWPLPVTLTAGFSGHYGRGEGSYSTSVHKGDLVQKLYRLMEEDRLKMAAGLPFVEQLVKEVRAFRPKQNARTGNLSYEAARESDHDDLVIALALSVWMAHPWGEAAVCAPSHTATHLLTNRPACTTTK